MCFSLQVRIFSYLTKDDGELFPGKLACDHDGSMKKLYNGENLISQMVNYFEFLSSNSKNTVGLWTSPYLDAWGLGLMLTHAVPCVSKLSNKYVIRIDLFVYIIVITHTLPRVSE